jgi:FkbM family methyltransferase
MVSPLLGMNCLYNASNESIINSINDVVFSREYFLLDSYKPKEGDVVVDVGAYVGLYAILSSMLVRDGGSVVAIEPVPHSFHLLARNVMLNKLNNVHLLNFALSNQVGEVEFYMPNIPSGSSFYISYMKTKDYAKLRVKTQTFDNLVESLDELNNRAVDMMKIDVEGAELSVLEGARSALKSRLINRLIVEVHKRVNSPETIMEFLKSHGYIVDGYFNINAEKGILYSRLGAPSDSK